MGKKKVCSIFKKIRGEVICHRAVQYSLDIFQHSVKNSILQLMALFYTNEGTVYSANSRCWSMILVFLLSVSLTYICYSKINLPTGLVCPSSHCPGAKKEIGELSPFLPSEMLKLHLLEFL